MCVSFSARLSAVLGLADGISSVAKGVANEVGGKFDSMGRKRPPRAFSRSTADPSVLVLSKYDPLAARAQSFVRKHSHKKKKKNDQFVCVACVDETSALIFSEMYLFWEKDGEIVWSCPWENVRCALLAQPLVEILLADSDERVRIMCRGESRCMKVYDCFVKNAHLLQEPASMCPIQAHTLDSVL